MSKKCKHGKEFGECKYYLCVNNTSEDDLTEPHKDNVTGGGDNE